MFSSYFDMQGGCVHLNKDATVVLVTNALKHPEQGCA